MSEQAKDSPRDIREPAASAVPGKDAPREKESGRIAFDARGNAVWEWKTADGEFRRDASTTLVRKLEAPHLQIETTLIARKRALAAPGKAPTPGGGFNPYESSAGSRRPSSVASRPVAVRPVAKPVAGHARRESGILHRLQAWVDGKGPAKRR